MSLRLLDPDLAGDGVSGDFESSPAVFALGDEMFRLGAEDKPIGEDALPAARAEVEREAEGEAHGNFLWSFRE